MIVYLIYLLTFLILVHLSFNYNARARLVRKIPGPKETFIIGNALSIIASPVELMKLRTEFSKNWKNIYRIWSYPLGCVNVYNPEDIEFFDRRKCLLAYLGDVQITLQPQEAKTFHFMGTKYNDKSVIYNFMRPWLQNGLLLSSGELWHQRRKLLTPAFHFNILRKFFVTLQENTQRLLATLKESDGAAIDIVPVISEYTLHSICETAMGTQLNEETAGTGRRYKEAIYKMARLILLRITRIYMYLDPIFYLTPTWRATKKELAVVHSFTQKVIKDRREYINEHGITTIETDEDDVYKKRKKTAMLDLLLLAEKDGLIDNAGIQEEVDTFMFEGHDTTAAGLTFTLMELANHKHIQDKIFDELKEIYGDSSRPATTEDLTKMRYLDNCIKESMRLYPPVHFISRAIDEPVVLSGYKLCPGNFCHIHILELHRNPELYKDPLVFDPDRFLPENSKGRHPYAYIPFSAGPRNCIGQKFAMMEMKLAISEIIRKFKLEPVTKREDIQFTADLVLRNSGPVKVSFVRR